MTKKSSAGVIHESSSSQTRRFWAICGTGFGAGWSSQGSTASAPCPGNARAGPATCSAVSPATAAPPPFNSVRREISCVTIERPFPEHARGLEHSPERRGSADGNTPHRRRALTAASTRSGAAERGQDDPPTSAKASQALGVTERSQVSTFQPGESPVRLPGGDDRDRKTKATYARG